MYGRRIPDEFADMALLADLREYATCGNVRPIRDSRCWVGLSDVLMGLPNVSWPCSPANSMLGGIR